MSNFSSRMADFKERFAQLVGSKRQGYEELDTLERPLVGAADDEYEQSRPGGGGYEPPVGGDAGAPRPASFTAATAAPSQADEIQEVSLLARDASEILWEMVAMGETGPAMEEMRSRAEMLQSQLRGLINDYSGGDEKLYAAAFESFDMLSRCLEDQKAPEAAPAAAAAAAEPEPVADLIGGVAEAEPAPQARPPPAAAPVPAAAPAPAAADLISFD